jgi:glycosyltransferase involved in cell wall biosynthesis
VAVSEWVKRYFARKYGVSEHKIEVIPNGTDIGRFAGGSSNRKEVDRASLAIAGGDVVLLNVGSLFGTKSQLHAIRVLSLLESDCPHLRLLIVASDKDPDYETVLREAVSVCGLDRRVTFCERTSRIGDYYRLADAVLMPSITEGWSLAMNESMFFELPMVLTDVGGASEALRMYKGGVLIPSACSDPLTLSPQSLWELAVNPEPPNLPDMVAAVRDLYRRIDYWKDRARGGRRLVAQRFSTEAVGELYATAILRTLWQHYGRCGSALSQARY